MTERSTSNLSVDDESLLDQAEEFFEVENDDAQASFPPASAAAAGLQSCLRCSTLAPAGDTQCNLCGRRLYMRRPQSLQLTMAFLLTAIVLYVPANLLPIMDTVEFGKSTSNTIIQGVLLLLHHGSYPTAIIIFIASVLVPVAKIIALLWLCWTVARRSPHNPHERERLYRITEFVGRWSMVDVFVVALLVALVQVTGVLSIAPGSAALAFCGMVVFTMLAADSFDSRLIWDHAFVDGPASPDQPDKPRLRKTFNHSEVTRD